MSFTHTWGDTDTQYRHGSRLTLTLQLSAENAGQLQETRGGQAALAGRRRVSPRTEATALAHHAQSILQSRMQLHS
eukprot:CAMPEP_0119370286 /NCGR_PEP_ID=MMETSP1334-20130426/16678_1 /TAXON_ID=127549 /ORGANISM="Calcidiscus leptoporus, Strain RCC1130" /LENGTH=75 /DNA_ID=CAMNT_0007387331 /DNA_START=125 /DNA_END=349 /DNA_ORIENTATION=+